MKKTFIPMVLAFLAGGIYSQAYPSFLGAGFFPLIFISIPAFLWLLESSTIKNGLLVTLAFNLGLDLVGYYWIPHTLREFGQLPWIISVLLGSLFCLILQPHWWVYSLWRRFRPTFDWQSSKGTILTALMITILERYIPQQFPSYAGSPWLHLAPHLGLAPIFGVALFSFITYWFSLETVAQLKNKKIRPASWITLSLFITLNAAMPIKNPEGTNHLKARIVQANIGNFLKISSESGDENSYQTIEKSYRELSTKHAEGLDLVIWPETAYPETFYGEQTQIRQIFHDIMESTDAEMLIGGYDQDMTKGMNDMIESVFNSSILISDGKVKTVYHKNILIPFGETLPFGPLNQSIVSIVPAVSLFARGHGTPMMETKNGHRFVTPICYEILETDYMRSLLNQHQGNHLIINHTNDSWYGDTAEPEQHLFLSKWRALEFNLPIIRSTNTGISSVIFPDGSESPRLKIGELNFLDVKVPLSEQEATIYLKWGIFPTLLIVGLLFLIVFVLERASLRARPQR